MKKIRDGWHKIAGYTVWVENGFITRGKHDNRPVYVYRACRTGGWDNEERITPDAFRAGVNRGTIKMA